MIAKKKRKQKNYKMTWRDSLDDRVARRSGGAVGRAIEIKYKGKSYVALVSGEDYEELSSYRWHVRMGTNGVYFFRTVSMHRQVLRLSDFDYRVGDHINGDTTNNTRENLRACTRANNSRNCSPVNGKRFKGVRRGRRSWIASCGGESCRGFKTKAEAAAAYDRMALEKWGQYARLNFPVARIAPKVSVKINGKGLKTICGQRRALMPPPDPILTSYGVLGARKSDKSANERQADLPLPAETAYNPALRAATRV